MLKKNKKKTKKQEDRVERISYTDFASTDFTGRFRVACVLSNFLIHYRYNVIHHLIMTYVRKLR